MQYYPPAGDWRRTANGAYFDTQEEANQAAEKYRGTVRGTELAYRVRDSQPEETNRLQTEAYQKVFDSEGYGKEYAEWLTGYGKLRDFKTMYMGDWKTEPKLFSGAATKPPLTAAGSEHSLARTQMGHFGFPYGTGRIPMTHEWEEGKYWERDKNLAKNAPVVDPDEAYLSERAPAVISADFGAIERRVLANLTEEKPMPILPIRKSVKFVMPNDTTGPQRVIPSVHLDGDGDAVLSLAFEDSPEEKTQILYIDANQGQVRLFNVGESTLAQFGLLGGIGSAPLQGRVRIKEY